MTRKEQIHKIANTISTNIGKEIDEDYICNDEYDFTIGFECGAKWADKTILDRACEWLSIYYPNIDRMGIDDFIERFKKAMEE